MFLPHIKCFKGRMLSIRMSHFGTSGMLSLSSVCLTSWKGSIKTSVLGMSAAQFLFNRCLVTLISIRILMVGMCQALSGFKVCSVHPYLIKTSALGTSLVDCILDRCSVRPHLIRISALGICLVLKVCFPCLLVLMSLIKISVLGMFLTWRR